MIFIFEVRRHHFFMAMYQHLLEYLDNVPLNTVEVFLVVVSFFWQMHNYHFQFASFVFSSFSSSDFFAFFPPPHPITFFFLELKIFKQWLSNFISSMAQRGIYQDDVCCCFSVLVCLFVACRFIVDESFKFCGQNRRCLTDPSQLNITVNSWQFEVVFVQLIGYPCK